MPLIDNGGEITGKLKENDLLGLSSAEVVGEDRIECASVGRRLSLTISACT